MSYFKLKLEEKKDDVEATNLIDQLKLLMDVIDTNTNGDIDYSACSSEGSVSRITGIYRICVTKDYK